MEWLNYHHLLYFWVVAKTGSVTRASQELLLAQPTISSQLRALEESLGEKLFVKVGRRLQLTETGKLVYGYADEIFSLGRELTDVLKGRPGGRPATLVVGISDMVPKIVAYRILEPALKLPEPVHLVCHEDQPEKLLLNLAAHELDLVLTDAPAHSGVKVRVFSHLLGSSDIALFAAPALAARYRKDFPQKLDGAPFLMPMRDSALRRTLEQWLDEHNIRPQIVGEFQDRALLNVFGQAGAGIFASPAAVEDELNKYYRVTLVGRLKSATEDFYAISAERKIKHPAVAAISESARRSLFASHNPQPA
ncbi:MAG TPA: transcriptional activator NhaR [Bryobacteraceae bacterium]|nr:transcriptional activator NhaR [Bryobacteraceae bacterium]